MQARGVVLDNLIGANKTLYSLNMASMGRLHLKSVVKLLTGVVALLCLAALGICLRSYTPQSSEDDGVKKGLEAVFHPREVNITTRNRLKVIKEPAGILADATIVAESFRNADEGVVDTETRAKDPENNLNRLVVSPIKVKRTLRKFVQRFPGIMIVGFGKAGTKALYDVLKMRPDLRGPATERRFFSDHYDKGLRYYLMSLPEPPPGGYVIEKSPDYIIDDPVPLRIGEAVKKLGISVETLKFIVVLRDPIDRAMSQYLEWQVARRSSGGKKLPPFHYLVWRKNGTIDSEQPFLKSSNYAKFIKQWFRYFNRTQTCFVDGDRFVKDPFSEVHLLESCLHLQPHFTPEHFVYESKRGFYCFKASVSQTEPHCMGNSKGRKHPPIPRDVYMALHEHYQPSDDQLHSLTGRTMLWLQREGR